MNNHSEEYNTVEKLFNDGKITAEERDKLLDALGENGDEESNGAEQEFSADEVADSKNNERVQINIDGRKSLPDMLSGLGKRITIAVRDGMRTANAALDEAGEELRRAARDISVRVDSADDADSIEKTVRDKYDGDYSDLNLVVKYAAPGHADVQRGSGSDPNGFLAECRKFLNDECYALIEKKINERFVGKYKFIRGGVVLKLSVTRD